MKISIKKIKHCLLSLIFFLLGLTFAAGYQYARAERIKFYDTAKTTTATIESVEGSFLKGRKVKETYYNYWIIFDSHRHHYQWPEKYEVGEKFQVAYEPSTPSTMKPVSRIEKNKNDEWKVLALFGVITPIIFLGLSFYNFRELKHYCNTLKS